MRNLRTVDRPGEAEREPSDQSGDGGLQQTSPSIREQQDIVDDDVQRPAGSTG